MKQSAMAVLAIFLLVQIGFIILTNRSLFIDEAIYAAAGYRTLAGQGTNDGYLIWFAGSLLWPVISALSHTILGVQGIRLVSVILITISLLFTYLSTKNIFNEKTALWTMVLLTLSGLVQSLAHLGVYDAPAILGITFSFWAITKLAKNDNRKYLVLAAIGLAFAFICKYPTGLMAIQLGSLIWIIRKHRSMTDLVIYAFVTIGVILFFMYPVHEQAGLWFSWSSANKPSFGLSRNIIFFQVLFYGFVYWLAMPICLVKSKINIQLKIWSASSLLMWPLYHLVSGNPVSMAKHFVLGFVFATPLLGDLFAKLWTTSKLKTIFLLTLITTIGIYQIYILDQSWPDTSKSSAYILENTWVGKTYLIDNSWPYIFDLLVSRNISTPWSVFDPYRIAHGEYQGNICNFSWFVKTDPLTSWSKPTLDQISDCENFKKVYTETQTLVGMGKEWRFLNYPVTVEVWKNQN